MFVSSNVTDAPYDSSANYPLSVAEFKVRNRISNSVEDAFIAECIVSATLLLERYLGRAIATQTRELFIDDISYLDSNDVIYISGLPIQSISSIKIYDEDNVESTIDSTTYILDAVNGRIALNKDERWSVKQRNINSVKITYICGYTSVPITIKSLVSSLSIYLYGARAMECDIPKGLKELASSYRVIRVGFPHSGVVRY